MSGMRAGGLASGLDTNAIIEKLVETAKQPINQLNDRSHLLTLEKKLYKDINSDLTILKRSVLDLRLESTFKNKKITSSNKAVANAKVSPSAKSGNYNLEVIQTARNTTAISHYSNAALIHSGANIERVFGSPWSGIDGTHRITVSSKNGKSIAKDEFKPADGRLFDLCFANDKIGGFIDSNGKILDTTVEQKIKFKIKNAGGEVELKELTYNSASTEKKIDDINELMFMIEQDLNNQINLALGTNNKEHVALRAMYNEEDKSWTTGIYYLSEESFVISGASGNLAGNLVLDQPTKPIHKVEDIAKYFVADNHDDLSLKLTSDSVSKGFIPGMSMAFNDKTTEKPNGVVKDGIFEIYQDSSMNVKKASKTRIEGGPTSLNFASEADYKKTLKELGFDTDALNGTFLLNDTKITIEKADKLTLGELMGIISSSGAGVSMTFNETTKQFILESKENGSVNISLGAGTSNFFDAFNLSVNKGGIKFMGNNDGKINVGAKIKDAGFTYTITKGVFSINDVPIYIDPEKETVQDLINKVNSSGAGVTLSYDEAADKFKIVSNDIRPLKFGSSFDTSNALNTMGFSTVTPGKTEYVGAIGQQAIFKVDGQEFRRNTNSISDAIGGVTFTLTGKGTTVLEVDTDTENAVDALAKFIQQYNSLIKKLRPEEISRQDRKNKMEALTEEKKNGMTKEEIEKYMKTYDELHTTDIMQKSSSIRSLMKYLRSDIMNSIPTSSSEFKSFSDMGIFIAGNGNYKITSLGYLITESTELEDIKKAIKDSQKLMENLEKKSDEVFKFFSDYEEVEVDEGNGVKKKVVVKESWVKRYEKTLTYLQDIAGPIGVKVRPDNSIDKELKRISTQIEKQTKRAEDYLERLWKQFSAMETRVAALQSQTQYIDKLAQQAAK